PSPLLSSSIFLSTTLVATTSLSRTSLTTSSSETTVTLGSTVTTTFVPTTTTTTTTTTTSKSLVGTTVTLQNGQLTVIFPQPTSDLNTGDSSANTGAVLGPVIGGFAVLLLIAGGIIYFYKRRNSRVSRYGVFKTGNHFDLGTLHPNAAKYNRNSALLVATSPEPFRQGANIDLALGKNERNSVVYNEFMLSNRNSVLNYNEFIENGGVIISDQQPIAIPAPTVAPFGYGYPGRQSLLMSAPAYVINPQTGETFLSPNGQLPDGFQYLASSSATFTQLPAFAPVSGMDTSQLTAVVPLVAAPISIMTPTPQPSIQPSNQASEEPNTNRTTPVPPYQTESRDRIQQPEKVDYEWSESL
ncbi:hypothetical protein HK096_007830, partial [Nowakowskiella sp. JEL0078]